MDSRSSGVLSHRRAPVSPAVVNATPAISNDAGTLATLSRDLSAFDDGPQFASTRIDVPMGSWTRESGRGTPPRTQPGSGTTIGEWGTEFGHASTAGSLGSVGGTTGEGIRYEGSAEVASIPLDEACKPLRFGKVIPHTVSARQHTARAGNGFCPDIVVDRIGNAPLHPETVGDHMCKRGFQRNAFGRATVHKHRDDRMIPGQQPRFTIRPGEPVHPAVADPAHCDSARFEE